MRISDVELLAWMQHCFWIFARVGGVMMTAPVIGARLAPARVRVLLSLMITLTLVPLVPRAAQTPELFSVPWLLAITQQLLIGVAMGFVLLLVFEAVAMGGELIATGMGLSFAQMTDPARNAATPLTAQLLTIMATLLFLSLGGHLTLIELLADSLRAWPPGSAGATPQWDQLAQSASLIFSGGLRVALPAVMALLLCNLAFGVMSRAAPAFNLQSVGLPMSLLAGLWLLALILPNLETVLRELLRNAWTVIAQMTVP